MATNVFPNPATPFGKRVQSRLRDEKVIWLTTVDADGTAQPNPVWFVAEGDGVVVYNQNGASRLKNIQRHPHVTLNFDDDGQGGDVVVMTGTAEIIDNPPANKFQPYVDKYEAMAKGETGSLAQWAARAKTAMKIHIDHVRGYQSAGR